MVVPFCCLSFSTFNLAGFSLSRLRRLDTITWYLLARFKKNCSLMFFLAFKVFVLSYALLLPFLVPFFFAPVLHTFTYI